ncbi:hypothetical protein [Cyclobacterium qasimii]|uniref:Uncharacterized protein n=2 Tax=Cyclobacterium qasimii TaxID=1350429 RepID=S7WQE9_9BACT|nr:hypothetical protein [Cyclobacterium qasimii]EPR66343.1 hypothetical protein ADICYQ_4477 [Cyclobacterium qasimii M12-11B]GEO21184.1 hypothetical protein CQA01_17180 [Cyclobacterium qasimii]
MQKQKIEYHDLGQLQKILNPDYVIGFVIACPVFTGSVAIERKSGCLEILA